MEEKKFEIDRSIAARLTPRLAQRFCPVPSFFLANYTRLRPHVGARGLTSTEAMVVVQLLDHKWDARAPFPTMATLAGRMGLAARTVRAALKNLEDLGYVRRGFMAHGGPNRYHFDGLFTALEKLMDLDAPATADKSDAANSSNTDEAVPPAQASSRMTPGALSSAEEVQALFRLAERAA